MNGEIHYHFVIIRKNENRIMGSLGDGPKFSLNRPYLAKTSPQKVNFSKNLQLNYVIFSFLISTR